MTAVSYDPKLFIDGYTTPAVDGGYHVNIVAIYTAAQIGDISNAVNTSGKADGVKIWDLTNSRVMEAAGSSAGDDWDAPNGSSSITPA